MSPLRAALNAYAPKALWVTVAVVLPFSVTTSFRAGAEVAKHQALDATILQRLNDMAIRDSIRDVKTDSIKITVDSIRWLMVDRERRCCTVPSSPIHPQ